MDECPFCGEETDSMMQCGVCLSTGCEMCVGDEGCPDCESDEKRSEEEWELFGSNL